MNAIRIALAGVALVVAGCINVEPIDGIYQCQIDSDCPKNYFCDGQSQTCWQHGHVPAVIGDMAMNDLAGTDSPLCHDGVQNGDETDVDCGGSCAPCATGSVCSIAKDCTSMLCSAFTHKCVGTKCEDGVRDGNETDIDCGGGACLACADGMGCKSNMDCTSDICNLATDKCAGTLCADGVKDGKETDVDCGGSACSKCLGGKNCDGNGDCLSNICGATHVCAASLCENGVKDPGETDTDCGGTTCSGCSLSKACLTGADCLSHFCNAVSLTCVADQCHDSTKNGSETDTDCGGTCGNTCKVGQSCKSAADCASGTCGANGTCVATQCMDGQKDGAETDKDCGGGTCPGCALGLGCLDGTRDCSSMFCNQSTKVCVADQCHDGAVDGSESDTDCGGPTCPHCAVNQGCKSANDCTSGWCNKDSLKCVATQCQDGIKDNGETDVDCGGGSTTGCSTCALGKGCGTVDANCASAVCNYVTGLCVATQCSDSRIDGVETDVDCGGGTCNACDPGKICKANGDCGSSACDFGPSPHKCITDQCVDHHQDGNETDVDCGGGTCSLCAVNKGCAQNSDCSTNYCDPASHKCACGGVGQACCAGSSCTQAANLCTGAISCSATNICVQSMAVTCPAAPDDCHTAGSCQPSTGMCSAATPLNGTPCNRATTDQCWVANTSTCSTGTCTGGTHVADKCANNDVQTCNNNTWSTVKTCANGCSGGVCNGPPVPTLTVKLDGSDAIVSWTAPAAGVTCTPMRNDNLGAGWQAPAAIITPCPASISAACNAYDRALLRGNYNYELVCKDSQGTTSTSAPFPSTGSLQPSVEICAADNATAVEVHTAAPTTTSDKLERQISASASFAATAGVAYLPPSPATNTNCAPGDHSCGTIYVASYSNDKVMSLDRRANDSDASSGGSQPPSASERILSITLKDSGVTQYQPDAVAVFGNTLVVGMWGTPGFLAGYPAGFDNTTTHPSWYIKSGSGNNKLGQAAAVAVDTGSGTGSGWVFVSTMLSNNSWQVNGYTLDDLTKTSSINSINFRNDTVAPFLTIPLPKGGDSIAIDSANHLLYVTDAGDGAKILEFTLVQRDASTPAGTQIGSFTGKGMFAPLGLSFLPTSNGGVLYVMDSGTVGGTGAVTGAILAFPAGANGGPIDPLINIAIPSLGGKAAGGAVCN